MIGENFASLTIKHYAVEAVDSISESLVAETDVVMLVLDVNGCDSVDIRDCIIGVCENVCVTAPDFGSSDYKSPVSN